MDGCRDIYHDLTGIDFRAERSAIENAALPYVMTTAQPALFALEAALTDASDKIVILRGDASIALGRAVNVLDLAQKAGAKGIAISTEQPEEEILIAP